MTDAARGQVKEHTLALRHSCCEKLEGCARLNPAAFRQVVEALRELIGAIRLQDALTQAVFEPRVQRATAALRAVEGEG